MRLDYLGTSSGLPEYGEMVHADAALRQYTGRLFVHYSDSEDVIGPKMVRFLTKPLAWTDGGLTEQECDVEDTRWWESVYAEN